MKFWRNFDYFMLCQKTRQIVACISPKLAVIDILNYVHISCQNFHVYVLSSCLAMSGVRGLPLVLRLGELSGSVGRPGPAAEGRGGSGEPGQKFPEGSCRNNRGGGRRNEHDDVH